MCNYTVSLEDFTTITYRQKVTATIQKTTIFHLLSCSVLMQKQQIAIKNKTLKNNTKEDSQLNFQILNIFICLRISPQTTLSEPLDNCSIW